MTSTRGPYDPALAVKAPPIEYKPECNYCAKRRCKFVPRNNCARDRNALDAVPLGFLFGFQTTLGVLGGSMKTKAGGQKGGQAGSVGVR
jgi:hypothetical protein